MNPPSSPRATIAGTGAALPAGRLTNAELEKRVDTSEEWIVTRTGILERRVAAPDESTATLATEAGRAAIKDAGLVPDDIDLLIVATATPEQPVPHTGAFVGHEVGLHCGSFDLAAGCAGFVTALVAGASMLGAGGLRHVLVVGAETLTRIIDPDDRATCVLFGDAAGAAVLARSPADGPGLLAWDLGCDGSAAGLLGIPAGGSRRPTTSETVAERAHYLQMEGQEVFRRAVRAVVASARLTLERASVESSDLACFVPHQANARIIEAAAGRLGIPEERTVINIERFGNTGAASIAVALHEGAEAERFAPDDLVLCSGFGAGMTWASVLLRWGRP